MPHLLPLHPAAAAATGMTHREGFLLRIEDDGRTGLGEATPLPAWGTEPLEATHAALRRALPRIEPGWPMPAGLEHDLAATPAARHAVALALLDLESQRAGEPLHRTLGAGRRVDRVPTHRLVTAAATSEVGPAIATLQDQGATRFKLKLPADPETAIAMARAARAAAPAATLRFDANGRWSPGRAETTLVALARVEPDVVEQPIAPGSPATIAKLEAATGVPLALDEDVGLATDRETLLSNGGPSWIVLKPMVLGGPDIAVRLALLAQAHGKHALVTTALDGVVGRLGAIHTRAALDSAPAGGLATGGLLRQDLAPDPCWIRNDEILLPRGPGLGVAEPMRWPPAVRR